MTTVPLADDGYIVIAVTPFDAPPGTEPSRYTLDTFEVFNALQAVRKAERTAAEANGRLPAVAERCRDYLKERHQIDISAALATRVFNVLGAEVDRLEKKDLSPDSAATPAPSASPSGLTDQSPTPPA